jgi:enamine deaminase RidA (YjgF/YER057c/UK114 family)
MDQTSDIKRTAGGARGRSRIVESDGLVWTVATAQGKGISVAAQTRATLEHLEANLEEAGSGKHQILEAVVYLADMSTKAEMDEVWCDWIPDDAWPCRACVAVNLAPGDLVEIKVTAKK